jgi:hypothetical protein
LRLGFSEAVVLEDKVGRGGGEEKKYWDFWGEVGFIWRATPHLCDIVTSFAAQASTAFYLFPSHPTSYWQQIGVCWLWLRFLLPILCNFHFVWTGVFRHALKRASIF